ncbi:hypothetical protein BpHYR1_045518 [Brachionus plicatilis]|uniref:Uncharacterized protein n=1 Tax=Brachionus plicatilis TaxID=10195 RepID=A0A3M7SGA8_BRAPC|nr:hypothetical protein BpHYR1_045518 [Brachionus plicatilis]
MTKSKYNIINIYIFNMQMNSENIFMKKNYRRTIKQNISLLFKKLIKIFLILFILICQLRYVMSPNKLVQLMFNIYDAPNRSQNVHRGYSSTYRNGGEYSDLNGSQNGPSNPVLYEFTFRRFFDETTDNKLFTNSMDEYDNDNSFKSFIKNISANQNLLKSDSEKMDFKNIENVNNMDTQERNLSPTLTSMMASVTTSCKTLNEDNYCEKTINEKVQLKESTNFNSYATTDSLNEGSIQIGKENFYPFIMTVIIVCKKLDLIAVVKYLSIEEYSKA